MTLSLNETRSLIEEVLASSPERARFNLHDALRRLGRTEPEFCAGVIEHHAAVRLSSNQWFDLFVKIPNQMLLRETKLIGKLSASQRVKLLLE